MPLLRILKAPLQLLSRRKASQGEDGSPLSKETKKKGKYSAGTFNKDIKVELERKGLTLASVYDAQNLPGERKGVQKKAAEPPYDEKRNQADAAGWVVEEYSSINKQSAIPQASTQEIFVVKKDKETMGYLTTVVSDADSEYDSPGTWPVADFLTKLKGLSEKDIAKDQYIVIPFTQTKRTSQTWRRRGHLTFLILTPENNGKRDAYLIDPKRRSPRGFGPLLRGPKAGYLVDRRKKYDAGYRKVAKALSENGIADELKIHYTGWQRFHNTWKCGYKVKEGIIKFFQGDETGKIPKARQAHTCKSHK